MSKRFDAGPFAAGGIPFVVQTNRSDLATQVGDVFRDLRVAETASSPIVFEVNHLGAPAPLSAWEVWRDGELRLPTAADSYVVTYLLWEISRLIFERTGERAHLHGAALVRNQRAVVLAGRSHAGKSTLAAWLTHRGWGFLTDEAALVDPRALVVSPFWRPINIRRPGPLESLLPESLRKDGNAEVLIPASTIGRLAGAAPLAAIAFPCFTSQSEAGLSPMSPAATLVELTQHFPALGAEGRTGFRRLASLVKAVPAYRLDFHDLDVAERALRTLADGA